MRGRKGMKDPCQWPWTLPVMSAGSGLAPFGFRDVNFASWLGVKYLHDSSGVIFSETFLFPVVFWR
jgi:hypothetical protein